jgi:hypothetical protein
MANPSRWDDLIRLLGRQGGDAKTGVRYSRGFVKTAEFDPETLDIAARGYRAKYLRETPEDIAKAREVGERALKRYRDGEVAGLYSRGTAAYPKGDRETRRHELFHGLASNAETFPEWRQSPTLDRLGALQRLAGTDNGLSRILEELAAQSVGKRRRLSASEAMSIAADYAPSYRRSGGLLHAAPAYAIGYGPLALAGGAAAGLGTQISLPFGTEQEVSADEVPVQWEGEQERTDAERIDQILRALEENR